MTSEGTKETEPWIEQKKVKYAYGYNRDGSLGRFLGVTGIPFAALIDSDGTVVWTGHPGTLGEKQIEPLLATALTKPLWEWPASAKAAKSAYAKGQVAQAIQELKRLNDPGSAAIVAALQDQVAARIKVVEGELRRGNLLAVEEFHKKAKPSYAGMDQLAAIEALAQQASEAPNASKILAVQRKLLAWRLTPPTKRKEREKLLDELRKISREFQGSYPAQEAEEMILAMQRQ